MASSCSAEPVTAPLFSTGRCTDSAPRLEQVRYIVGLEGTNPSTEEPGRYGFLEAARALMIERGATGAGRLLGWTTSCSPRARQLWCETGGTSPFGQLHHSVAA